MSIVSLKRMTLCGLLDEKASILHQLQALGGAHLIPLTEMPESAQTATQHITEKAVNALKYLMQCRNKRHQVHDDEEFNLETVVDNVAKVRYECRLLSDQRDFLLKRIAEIEPWGDFQLTEKDDLGPIQLWFYIVPKRLMHKLNKALVYQVVHQDNLYCYVVVLSEQEPDSTALPVARTHTGRVPLSQLKKQLQQTELRLEDLQAERESLTRWITLISLSLVKNEEHADLKVAHTMTLDSDPVFVSQAWIPASETERYADFAKFHGLAIQFSDPEPNDKPPTLLSNQEELAGGEEVISFYQTPSYFDWDPSVVVFFSFALFFAMILSDAGYALVFGVLLMLKWSSLKRSKSRRRLRMLAAVTIGCSLVWGVLTGSYFGLAPTGQGFIAKLKIFDLQDFDSMMRLSIGVGVGHIALANLVKFYQNRRRLSALAPLGWVLAVIGGFTYWLALEQANESGRIAAYALLTLAAIFVLGFNSERPVRQPVDLLWRLLQGLKSLTGVTRIFGDVLSYMRLFALGLASASLALTFNQLAGQVYHSVPGVGLLFSLLILLFGHGLNLLLCLMSGLVHGLRLNFIEFYNWSVSDEGYPFKAFSRKGG
ncbi:ATPase [Methylomarinum sp. Ch1-1]|uniref:ATPase n=1 Tax=Methylomarinum roseum TaxID=3067653 RepID=A0AAU7NQP6_9GAMM|nr:ATPase [Methylomarinum sp. Ch1-1]MDP4520784.1 ATPase [Methylomarinum sp. Ch1-1]